MKIAHSTPLAKFLLGLAGFLALTAGAEENLFNGRDLAGWRGDSRLWRVEEGVLIGETDGEERRVEKNSFLIREGDDLADFELSLKVRITGKNNSGVQYRARVVDEENFAVHGYQMDLHPRQEYNAMLYEEGGRGILCLRGQSLVIDEAGERKVEALAGGLAEVDLAEWNQYRLVAKGPVLEHWLNGKLAARIEDREKGKRSESGVLALQLHAGPPMRAEFKEIVLNRLSDKEEEVQEEAAAPSGEKRARWIWGRARAEAEEEVFLRRAVKAPKDVVKALVTVSADNEHELFLDGKSIGQAEQWEVPSVYDVTGAFSKAGNRLFMARARNRGGPAGLAFQLEMTLASGEKQRVVSDGNWSWSETGEAASSWKPVAVVGEMGDEPWGYLFGDAIDPGGQKVRDVTAEYQTLPGFKLERIYQVPKTHGSWVAMTVDGEGRLIASDQYGQLVRMTAPAIGDADAVAEVEALDLPLVGAQGLLWAHDALYVVVSIGESGVYRVTDSDGDGELDQVEKLKALEGGGEHGPHGLVSSPDGEWIYLVSGNHTRPPEFDHSLVPEVWDEDQLLPRRPDARGHARGVMAPGGWVARFTPGGERWEFVSSGYRNAYGLAFNDRGDLFTYDSDMEWDMGAPWYRPTRICHVTSGSEFGWRHGTGKWPDYYEDSLPSVLDIGPGSPTGVVAGKGLRFPARYQHALYMLDWTYATIYAVHLVPEGATYTAKTEELVAGAGLPVTDAVVGVDGALYFAVGGRRIHSAVFRVIYTGDEPTAPAADPEKAGPQAERLATLRRDLESLHQKPDPAALDEIWAALAHEDRFIRFAARTALEHLPPAIWKGRLSQNPDTWQALLGGMVLARTGTSADQIFGLNALDRLDPRELDEATLLNLLRAYGLVFARHGPPAEARRAELAQRFDAIYPADTDHLNRELCRMLVYLKSDQVLAKSLRLMAAGRPVEIPDWAELATRNERYGQVVRQMIDNMPSPQNLFYVYCLRTLEGPWRPEQRRQFFTWLSEAARKSGGRSYGGFIVDLRDETLERATPQEREMIESWNLDTAADPFKNLPPVEGPGRNWTVEEAVAAAGKGLVNRDLARGKRMYQASLCAACHQFGGEGGGSGPDLSLVGSRFGIRDLLEAIVKPDQEVSDQYRFDVITTKEGTTLRGKIVDESNKVYLVAPSAFDLTETMEVAKESVKKIEPSPVSPMPPATINRLNEDELRDLLAYLMAVE